MGRCLLTVKIARAWFLLAAGPAHAVTFSYTTIAVPGANFTFVNGINSAGELVGNYYSDGSPNTYGFTDVNGTFTTLSDPASAINTDPTGINDAGQIVGTYYDSNSAAHGLLYQNHIYTSIDDPAGVHGTMVNGINNAGEIVGTYFDSNFGSHGFIDSGGHFVTVNAPGTTSGTNFAGINNRGQIVGYTSGTGNDFAFVDTNGSFATISDPLATNGTVPLGINDADEIDGYYFDTNPKTGNLFQGFVETKRDFFNTADQEPEGINDAGEIVGFGPGGSYDSNDVGFVGTPNLAPVPEPASLTVLSFAACCLELLRRTRGLHSQGLVSSRREPRGISRPCYATNFAGRKCRASATHHHIRVQRGVRRSRRVHQLASESLHAGPREADRI